MSLQNKRIVATWHLEKPALLIGPREEEKNVFFCQISIFWFKYHFTANAKSTFQKTWRLRSSSDEYDGPILDKDKKIKLALNFFGLKNSWDGRKLILNSDRKCVFVSKIKYLKYFFTVSIGTAWNLALILILLANIVADIMSHWRSQRLWLEIDEGRVSCFDTSFCPYVTGPAVHNGQKRAVLYINYKKTQCH